MNIKSLSDAQLVNNYISGQESALSILINRHQQRLYGFIFSKVYDRDATEDIFQDTFVKVIKTLKKGKYNEQGKFLPSATSIIGARTNKGLELGVGPNLSLSGVGMVFGVGYNFKSGNLNLPVNLAFMPGRNLTGTSNGEEYDYNSGARISLMIGFNMSK